MLHAHLPESRSQKAEPGSGLPLGGNENQAPETDREFPANLLILTLLSLSEEDARELEKALRAEYGLDND